jgi:cell surface protein SprA
MTTLRKLVEETTQVSAGALAIDINATADYQISKMVGLRFYYTQSINKPYIQLSYDTMNIDAGITVRLMLTQ